MTWNNLNKIKSPWIKPVWFIFCVCDSITRLLSFLDFSPFNSWKIRVTMYNICSNCKYIKIFTILWQIFRILGILFCLNKRFNDMVLAYKRETSFRHHHLTCTRIQHIDLIKNKNKLVLRNNVNLIQNSNLTSLHEYNHNLSFLLFCLTWAFRGEPLLP